MSKINISLSPVEAIALHYFLANRVLMQSKQVPQLVKDSMADAAHVNGSLTAVEEKLATDLNELHRQQLEKAGASNEDWNLPEKLKKLNITAPSDWNQYDAYLLDGGTLEYEEWKAAQLEGDRPLDTPEQVAQSIEDSIDRLSKTDPADKPDHAMFSLDMPVGRLIDLGTAMNAGIVRVSVDSMEENPLPIVTLFVVYGQEECLDVEHAIAKVEKQWEEIRKEAEQFAEDLAEMYPGLTQFHEEAEGDRNVQNG